MIRGAVAIYTHELLPWSETFILEQARSLSRWRPTLVAERRSVGGLLIDGMATLILEGEKGRLGRKLHRRFCRAFGKPDAMTVRSLRDLAPDLIHAHFGTAAVDIWPIAKALGIPLLVTLHGYDATIFPAWWKSGRGGLRKRAYPMRLEKLANDPMVFFIAVSEALRVRAQWLGIPESRIRTAHIGIDCSSFEAGTDAVGSRPRIVLFVGRLVEKKGVEYLIDALVSLSEAAPKAQLRIVGDGPLRVDLERRAAGARINAKFIGAVSPARVRDEMRHARVLCLPSITARNGDAEGFGLVLLEAQAMGIPVVSSALGGATEGIIHGETGFAVDEKDVASIARYIEQLLYDDALANHMSIAAQEFVRGNFDLQERTRELEVIYDEVARLRHT